MRPAALRPQAQHRGALGKAAAKVLREADFQESLPRTPEHPPRCGWHRAAKALRLLQHHVAVLRESEMRPGRGFPTLTHAAERSLTPRLARQGRGWLSSVPMGVSRVPVPPRRSLSEGSPYLPRSHP